jgi:glucose/arabinose dehydrogenase
MMNRYVAALAGACLSIAAQAQNQSPFEVEAITSFDQPWAMAFLPDGRMLVTEMKGSLYIVGQDGVKSRKVGGVPDVDYRGQGGLGDVAVHPDFSENGLVYLSYAESAAGDTRGAAVVRGKLTEAGRDNFLSNVEVIWRQ